MIQGTGIDIIEIERIERAIKRWGDHFLSHLFNTDEIAYASRYKFPAKHYAVRFAAKEAIYKAFGGQENLGWKDVSILNDTLGKPICVFKNKTITQRIHLSLSHSKYYAVANAIITD